VIPHYSDPWLTVYAGDCRAVLATLPSESVHCVVTSPPYWGLRDYGTATWAGGDDGCDHKPPMSWIADSGDLGERGHILNANEAKAIRRHGGDCLKCGAIRQDSQLGLEPTPDLYVENMVAVFREVRRVLRSDGTCWLNLGDSYVGTGSKGDLTDPKYREGRNGQRVALNNKVVGLKSKDLVGIPWMVAFALRADGWWLRQDIIWSKPNPMPESVTDRPTKSHEYLFLLAKSQRYYFDSAAVREPSGPFHAGGAGNGLDTPRVPDPRKKQDALGKNTYTGFNDRWREKPVDGRNIRSVWTIATQPYPGAHFATFPPKLVEPCIKAGCPEGGVVLDPFAGSGTVGVVAQHLSRRAVLIDLNPAYIEQQTKRNAQTPLGLVGASA